MGTKLKLFLFLLLFTSALTFTLFSCSSPTQPPPKNNGSLTLSLEETSSIEVWVKLNTQNVALPADINILLDSKLLTNINLASADTTLYIDSLQPNKSYGLIAQFTDNTGTASSNQLTVQTLGTTSHNFTWQKYTFGVGASSILRDVAIIDENNIWAVGEIYMNDSTGKPDPHAYNAVHWDGSKWEVKRIYFPTVCGQTSLTPYPSRAIFAFNDGQIWVSSSGDKIAILKDGEQINKFCLPSSVSMSINKIWGTSSNDLYIVGKGGNIAHYNGARWQRIESGTDLPINDIYGDDNPFTGETEIICGAYNQVPRAESEIIRIKDDNTTEKLDRTGLGNSFAPIWFRAGIRYYLVGGGLYEKKYNSTAWVNLNRVKSITLYFMNSIRGNDLNDIYVAGAYGEMLHYNGSTWKSFMNRTSLTSGAYNNIAVKGNIIVAVGFNGNKGIILIGKR